VFGCFLTNAGCGTDDQTGSLGSHDELYLRGLWAEQRVRLSGLDVRGTNDLYTLDSAQVGQGSLVKHVLTMQIYEIVLTG
jgi:hypothetical protein